MKADILLYRSLRESVSFYISRKTQDSKIWCSISKSRSSVCSGLLGTCHEHTHMYLVQRRIYRSVGTNKIEVIKLTGIHLLIGVMKLPQFHVYWFRGIKFPLLVFIHYMMEKWI